MSSSVALTDPILLNSLALTALALASATFVVAVVRACRQGLRPALWGALTFVAFALVLKPLGQAATGPLPIPGPADAAALLAFVLGSAGIAGLFEETGKWLALRAGHRRRTLAKSWVLSFAAGYAICETWVVGSGHVQLLLLASDGELLARLQNGMPAAAVAALQQRIAALDAATAAWLLTERAAAVVLQIGLVWMVWNAIERRRPAWLAAAVLAHALIDVPAALFHTGTLPLWAIETLYLSLALLVAVPVWRHSAAALAKY